MTSVSPLLRVLIITRYVSRRANLAQAREAYLSEPPGRRVGQWSQGRRTVRHRGRCAAGSSSPSLDRYSARPVTASGDNGTIRRTRVPLDTTHDRRADQSTSATVVPSISVARLTRHPHRSTRSGRC